ncbi:PAS domain-containing sensor histidine kinase [Spirochaeta africana]|uniref:histidine kinase n=1 Tax=Spirochaeta africana (strain ATCC 700263 / DSM 8902 / Z-7692) TaxID=889378 RepID=H9UG29_SPIAZ|nr:PAS domain-containing sensor histidine kinase [Spirochaeta africana]AFG36472.1 PAS domain S-box [Spirochaeta africana DSM 8902]
MANGTNSSQTAAPGSADRLYKIIESTPVGICITDKGGIFEYVNPTYCRLYGYSESELVGNHFTMVVPEGNRDYLSQLHDDFMQQTVELRGEWAVQRRDGSIMNILADASYILDVDNEPKKVTFVMDITRRKQMEVELERTVSQLNQEIEERKQLERTKDEVEKMMRHDLRNPLNAILIATQLLMSHDLDEQQRGLVNMIQDSGQKLNYMISSSIDFIRMEEGTYHLKPRRLRVTDLVRTVMQETLPAREASEVTVSLLLDGAPMPGDAGCALEGERIHLENLFSNLLRNAIEASPQGSEVVWETLDRGDSLEFRIHNEGVIPLEIRSEFFKRFSTSGKRNGTGLGTHIAKLITSAHGGTIRFETGLEQGTTLFVELPVQQPLDESSEDFFYRSAGQTG